MTNAKARFDAHLSGADKCIENFDARGDDFALKHVWVIGVSAFDLYMTELVSEAGLRWIDRDPPVLTTNLKSVRVPLGSVLEINQVSPTERLLFYRDHVYSAVQYTSFYKPDKVSEALSYIWNCDQKEKWTRICGRMKLTGRYDNRTEQDIRGELTFIGDRRDLIAHSVDTPPGQSSPNPVTRADAARVREFMTDLATAIDAETESQLAAPVA